MAVQFHVLASGSSGNCCLLDLNGFGVLIDLGLGPRQLAGRWRHRPPVWQHIQAVLLTHVHGDHWNENSLNHLAQRGIPLYCHQEHAAALPDWSPAFVALAAAGLVRSYTIGEPLPLGEGCRAIPMPLKHDGGMTCGFRVEGPRDVFDRCWALAYAADLGSWDETLANWLSDVDVLALEFNHDVALQYASGRSPRLIRRVLGDQGHLSNTQAAALFAEVLRQSERGRLQHLVQLHLSRQCNRHELAHDAAQHVVRHHGATVQVHTTSQEFAGPTVSFGDTPARTRRRRWPTRKTSGQSPSLFRDW
jgi:phosphoribosyl 1,2-cyclic phosphodiesterase